MVEDWNKCFKDKANLRNPAIMEQFWSELKDRLLKRYGTMADAFEAIAKGEKSEDAITFTRFAEVLHGVDLQLKNNLCRGVFQKAAGGERLLNLMLLKELLLKGTIGKLSGILIESVKKKERIRGHVRAILRKLAIDNAEVCVRSVGRFQGKLTTEFVRVFWQYLLADLAQPMSPDLLVSFNSYQRCVRKAVAERHLLPYDGVFMMRIFHRIEQLSGSPAISISAVVATLLLLSPETDPDRMKKVTLMFSVFDWDFDGCLLWPQVEAIFLCLSKQKPAAEASDRSMSDLSFQLQLSREEGMHAYEQTRWHLQRGQRHEGDVVTLHELTVALKKQQELVLLLMPSIKMSAWSEQATPVDNPDSEQVPVGYVQLVSTQGSAWQNTGRTASLHRTGGTRDLGSTQERPRSALRSTSPARNTRAQTPKTPNRDFRRTRTKLFQQSLTQMGSVRIAELTRGFSLPTIGQLEEGTEKKTLPRLGSASSPALLPAMSLNENGRKRACTPQNRALAKRYGVPSISPKMRSQRWGIEAVERFRIATSIRDDELALDASKNKTMGVPYECQLCERAHSFKAPCSST